MDVSHRHMRHFLRLALPDLWQTTEMVTASALLHGAGERLLAMAPGDERRTVLQLGGSAPDELAEAARIGVDFGYPAVNLNVGCPSPRVQRGAFGACLMLEPARVAECVAAMRSAVDVPVTVKCRLGVDDHDAPEFLQTFLQHVFTAGCDGVTVHARIAILDGLSPKENREIPPLKYDRVLAAHADWPGRPMAINGGIRDPEVALGLLTLMDGVMIGRLACEAPWAFLQLARALGEPLASGIDPDDHLQGGCAWLERYRPWAERAAGDGTPMPMLCRHVLPLFNGRPGARAFRRTLSSPGAHPRDVPAALACLRQSASYAPAI